MAVYPAALDLPHALVEWVTMLIVTREGDRRCKLRPSQRAVITLVSLREHTTCAKRAAGFRISESTAHAYAQSVIKLLASRAPSLTQALRRARPEYVPVDGTIAECYRVGDHERDYSAKARRHGEITDPRARRQSLRRGRRHVPGAVQTPPRKTLTVRQAAVNQAHARLRFPVERAFARLKAWRIADRKLPGQSRCPGCDPPRPMGRRRDLASCAGTPFARSSRRERFGPRRRLPSL
ncbi:transposase family protein [Streptomyces sp. NPDC051180]|uniref:transposase family protein n=1 Tax=Streptomyces sp. NPDC051180 TaxID=3155797 RepID=UPI00344C9B28